VGSDKEWWVVSFPDCIFRARWKSSLGMRLEWREGRWGCVMMVEREGGGGGGGM